MFYNFECYRCMWAVRCRAHRVSARKISMCIRRILPDTVSKSANPVRKTTPKIAITENSIIASNRAAIFRPSSWKNPNRDINTRHVAQWQQFQLAIHVHNVTLCMAAASFRITIIILKITTGY